MYMLVQLAIWAKVPSSMWPISFELKSKAPSKGQSTKWTFLRRTIWLLVNFLKNIISKIRTALGNIFWAAENWAEDIASSSIFLGNFEMIENFKRYNVEANIFIFNFHLLIGFQIIYIRTNLWCHKWGFRRNGKVSSVGFFLQSAQWCAVLEGSVRYLCDFVILQLEYLEVGQWLKWTLIQETEIITPKISIKKRNISNCHSCMQEIFISYCTDIKKKTKYSFV